ncbi:hypothetical protein AVEN_259384-1 [Araneus ventricosus]|uniref:Uncharacterized protein n=1 Tax=Araneus ventricosus TaxID=182803 RepID=A0A4Y2DT82_ARAVE|nr:hypothetical protein AVEN_259384-1 [Araneus ventricosus]
MPSLLRLSNLMQEKDIKFSLRNYPFSFPKTKPNKFGSRGDAESFLSRFTSQKKAITSPSNKRWQGLKKSHRNPLSSITELWTVPGPVTNDTDRAAITQPTTVYAPAVIADNPPLPKQTHGFQFH